MRLRMPCIATSGMLACCLYLAFLSPCAPAIGSTASGLLVFWPTRAPCRPEGVCAAALRDSFQSARPRPLGIPILLPVSISAINCPTPRMVANRPRI